jgi:hypothetical protein
MLPTQGTLKNAQVWFQCFVQGHAETYEIPLRALLPGF